MSGNYIPLYRKYRPQTLESLVGQEHIKKTLTSAIELGKISHAYLFTGPRGTGKTSTARILAKSLNCKNGPTVHPCGECESCKDITNSIPIDVIEIDAASNRKVEDAQNILEKIQYVPVNGKYKIYIIDEVHMLSAHAFNALLKTLEEPPENVIFILATTEVHKVLDTIKSRCQRFDFRRITTEDIVKHLRYISDNEKINIDDDALFAIAKNSAGGMRDSISLLDQLSILGISKKITVDDVNSILGRLSFDVLNKLTSTIISSSHSKALEVLNNIYNSGNEPLQILTNLCEYFKNLLVAKTCSDKILSELTGLNEPQIKELLIQVEKLEVQQIVFLIERISYYIKEVKLASNQHLWLEVGIIDLANMTENTELIKLRERIEALESGSYVQTSMQAVSVTRPVSVQPQNLESKQANDSDIKLKQSNKDKVDDQLDFSPVPMSKKNEGTDIMSMWSAILSNISASSTQAMLRQLASPLQISKEGVVIAIKSEYWANAMNNEPQKKQLISDAVKIVLNADVPLVIRLATAADTITEQEHVQGETKKTDDKKNKSSAIDKKEISNSDEPKESEDKSTNNDIKTENEKAKDSIKKTESDQEKMILDLFDGKYVE